MVLAERLGADLAPEQQPAGLARLPSARRARVVRTRPRAERRRGPGEVEPLETFRVPGRGAQVATNQVAAVPAREAVILVVVVPARDLPAAHRFQRRFGGGSLPARRRRVFRLGAHDARVVLPVAVLFRQHVDGAHALNVLLAHALRPFPFLGLDEGLGHVAHLGLGVDFVRRALEVPQRRRAFRRVEAVHVVGLAALHAPQRRVGRPRPVEDRVEIRVRQRLARVGAVHDGGRAKRERAQQLARRRPFLVVVSVVARARDALLVAIHHRVEVQLLLGALHDALLDGARRHESVDVHGLRLADAVRAVHGL
mmetsp:Transcript_15157/g.46869  ORF Transcript_15157/g.46869 Transcript_15157/m.46869 type:complete len:311 (-) Transcript_15157:2153-3085(-)